MLATLSILPAYRGLGVMARGVRVYILLCTYSSEDGGGRGMAPNDNNKYWIPLSCQCSFFTAVKKEPRHGPVFRYLVWIMVGNSPTTRTIPPPNHRNTRFSFNGSELVVCGAGPTPPHLCSQTSALSFFHTTLRHIPSPVLPCLPAPRHHLFARHGIRSASRRRARRG